LVGFARIFVKIYTQGKFSMTATQSLQADFSSNTAFAKTGLFMLALSLPVLIALAIDTREFQDQNVWIKPLKFQLSLALHLLTLAWFAQFLPQTFTARRGYRMYSYVVIFSILAEVAWIDGAAMFATASHFNFDSPAMIFIYSIMGVFAVILTSPALVYGVIILRKPQLTPFEIASGIALCLTFVLTVIVAGKLSSSGGHFVGMPSAANLTVPVIGWSREVGDLRVAHFFATHTMHFLPALAVVLSLALGNTRLKQANYGAALIYVAFVAVVFVQALNGLPLLAAS
jgi:hypothetical protein